MKENLYSFCYKPAASGKKVKVLPWHFILVGSLKPSNNICQIEQMNIYVFHNFHLMNIFVNCEYFLVSPSIVCSGHRY
jgi:hypothetical protein